MIELLVSFILLLAASVNPSQNPDAAVVITTPDSAPEVITGLPQTQSPDIMTNAPVPVQQLAVVVEAVSGILPTVPLPTAPVVNGVCPVGYVIDPFNPSRCLPDPNHASPDFPAPPAPPPYEGQ